MKKLLAIIIAAVMIAACSVTAFAADTTTVTYEVQPTYTVSIPASVTLSDADVTADVTASDVILESGKKIKVELTSASNTASGSTFNAKNGDSTVTYTITGDKAIAVGDTVATFTANGSKTLTFSAADKSAATVAGTHTETLTFGIAVENAAAANPYAANALGDVVTFGSYDWYIIGKSDNGVTLLMKENLTTKGYNDSYASVTWETCSLRTYLNGEFYNGSGFSDDDRAKIVKTSITNPNNPNYGTNGGNATEDYIYLLSIDEANALSDTIRANGSGWWLRSPGSDSHFAAFVNGGGDVLTNGGNLSLNRGVRPVLNLKF